MLNSIKDKIRKTVIGSFLKKLIGKEHGMTTFSEQKYFRSYACNEYSGVGEIVDLGSWLGSTTVSLAKGLIENKNCQNKTARIHAFDLFIWQTWMNKAASNTLLKKYKPGDSFLDEFERRIKKYSTYIEVYPGDLGQIGWNDQEIEFLLVDAMKSWKLTSEICRKFFPFLIPGKSLVLHQDFGFFGTPWIHLINYRFRDYFDFHYDVPNSSSIVLKYTSPIPPEKLEFEYSFDSFTEEEVESAFNYSLEIASKEKRSAIVGSKVMFFALQEEFEKARSEIDRYLEEGCNITINLEKAIEFVDKKGVGDFIHKVPSASVGSFKS